jgi:tetratricopeptide (TPR) repeat protein
MLLLKLGSYTEARDCAEEAIALNAKSWESHLLLSKARWNLGDLEDARQSARRATELNREEPRVRKWWTMVNEGLGENYLKDGRYADARDCLREAIVVAEASPTSHLLLSQACLKVGDFRGALHATARAGRSWWERKRR